MILLISYYLLPATYYRLPTTYYLLPTSYYYGLTNVQSGWAWHGTRIIAGTESQGAARRHGNLWHGTGLISDL